MFRKKIFYFMMRAGFCFFIAFPITAQAAPFKVLTVMSYEQDYPWVSEIREGIESALKKNCNIKYFYMNSKTNIEAAPQKATEAYTLYQEFQPDGVIAADDNAQSMFVVPYLKDKVKTPVMFCGVNAAPEKYGYPASNVSGVLERFHTAESLAFVQQLVPSVKTAGCLMADNPSGKVISEQIIKESDGYSVKFVGVKLAKTLSDLTAMTEAFKKECDVLITPTLQGIIGQDGKSLTDKDLIPLTAKIFGKPVISGGSHQVPFGALCAVVETGQEQGRTAAKMLLKAMKGMPVSDLPVTRNRAGRRILNATVVKLLGLNPDLSILQGVELVKTE